MCFVISCSHQRDGVLCRLRCEGDETLWIAAASNRKGLMFISVSTLAPFEGPFAEGVISGPSLGFKQREKGRWIFELLLGSDIDPSSHVPWIKSSVVKPDSR